MTTTKTTTDLPDEPGRVAGRTSPLLDRFPALGRVPRVPLARVPTPITPVTDPRSGAVLWIKREDLSGARYGGNKIRPLEFLLAGLQRGDQVLTVGGRGSTHALATATFARELGAQAIVVRWRQEMNSDAESTARRCARIARCIDVGSPVTGFAIASVIRLTRTVRWIPAGGSSPLGLLGHVDAALEFVDQVRAGMLPPPTRVVVPLGSGGTAAGLALGFAIAGVNIVVDAVRVAPRVVANHRRVMKLAAGCARLIEAKTRASVARPRAGAIRVLGGQYGGAYGRATSAGRAAAAWLQEAGGPVVDSTYSAKALAAVLAEWPSDGLVFWLTYDGRPEERS